MITDSLSTRLRASPARAAIGSDRIVKTATQLTTLTDAQYVSRCVRVCIGGTVYSDGPSTNRVVVHKPRLGGRFSRIALAAPLFRFFKRHCKAGRYERSKELFFLLIPVAVIRCTMLGGLIFVGVFQMGGQQNLRSFFSQETTSTTRKRSFSIAATGASASTLTYRFAPTSSHCVVQFGCGVRGRMSSLSSLLCVL